MTRAQAHWMIGTWTVCMILGTQIIACTPVNIKPVATNCFPTVTYTPEFQNAAADELGVMANHYPHVSQMIVDYEAERKALKACAQ